MTHRIKCRTGCKVGSSLACRAAGRAGFTMVEVLIVIVVIALLVGISLTVAVRATSSGKVRATEHILKTVDQVITEYAATVGKIPAFHTDQFGVSYPLVDGVTVGATGPGLPQPALSLFLAEAAKVRLTDRMLQTIDSDFIQRTYVSAFGFAQDGSPVEYPVDSVVLLDGFGRPLRFSHPAFHGGYGEYYALDADTGNNSVLKSRANLIVKAPGTAFSAGSGATVEFRRSCIPTQYIPSDTNPASTLRDVPIGDADEGMCIANRPYVYSAGMDGNAGTRMDNIYINGRPQWPGETAHIYNDLP